MEDRSKIDITPDNINDYYDKINELIDKYFEWSVKPSALKKYFKSGSIAIKKFIDRNNLSNVNNIDKVIRDVVDDRYSMEKDGVLTFESFELENINELLDSDSEGTGLNYILYNNVEPSTLKDEKIIADYYRTGLGHIEEVNKELHEYTVGTLKADYNVIIFSSEDIGKITENLTQYLEQYLSKKTIYVAPLNLTVKLSTVIDKESIEAMVDSKKYIINIISEILNSYEYTYQKEFGGYHFWQR